MSFRVRSEHVGERTHVVAVAGELDLYTAPELEQALLAAIGAGATAVVVDLADTTFVDSVALGVLAGAAKELQRAAGRLVVACGRDVARFFEVAGLDQYFEIDPTRASALARVGA